MTSVHLSDKQSTLRSILGTIGLTLREKRVFGLTVLLSMIATMPVPMLLISDAYIDRPEVSEQFTTLLASFMFGLTAIALAVSAGLCFGYLFKRAAVDMLHALPIRRASFFISRFLGGFLLVLVPQVITFSVVLLLRTLTAYRAIDPIHVLTSAGNLAFLSLTLYATTVLAFVLADRLSNALFLFGMFNLLGPVTLYIIDLCLERVLPGFSKANYTSGNDPSRYTDLSPIGGMVRGLVLKMAMPEYLWRTALTILLVVASLLIYLRRDQVTHDRRLLAKTINLIIHFFLCVDAALLIGQLLFDQRRTTLAFVLGALLGSLAVYVTGEVIQSRSVRRFIRRLPIYAAFAGLFTLGCLVVITGGFGWDNRLPDKETVSQIEFLSNSSYFQYGNPNDPSIILTDPDSIAAMLSIHKNWLDEQATLTGKTYSLATHDQLMNLLSGFHGREFFPMRVVYRLESGASMCRTVYFDLQDEANAALFAQITATEEYKTQHYRVIFNNESRVIRLVMNDPEDQQVNDLINVWDGEILPDLLPALREDLLNNADDQASSPLVAILDLSIVYPSGDGVSTTIGVTLEDFPLTDSFEKSLAVLQDNGFLNKPMP